MPTSINYGMEILTEPLNPPQVGSGGYARLNPHSQVLPAGWKHPHPDTRPLPCAILAEHDVAIKMRDGVTLYADVYRPPEPSAPVPAILCWSPFGKKFNGAMSLQLMTPWSLGIPKGTLSGLEKFEGPDPADWVPRGHAIVNIDIRGTGDSGGIMALLGSQEAEDGHDTIEALAAMAWCNGAVGMAGNSHFAIAQWFIAATRPPHLKAIAPWEEGCGDLYREQFGRGGIYKGSLYNRLIVKCMLRGRPGTESPRRMWEKDPLVNRWWKDKRPDMRKIQVPTYIIGTWTNTMHGMGAIRGWLEVDTPQKWLRWHPWQEWYDLWGNPQALPELLAFFDHFLKGADNGWDQTPRVRMAVLRFGNKDPQSYENVVEHDFPIPRTEYRKLYRDLGSAAGPDGRRKLSEAAPSAPAVASYDWDDVEGANFTHTFEATTRLVGIPKAVLYMSCADHDDMDVYVQLEKLDADGQQMISLNIPWKSILVTSFDQFTKDRASEVVQYKGPEGILRASHRAMDEAGSMHPNWPLHPHDKEEKIRPLGTVVRLDIGIWAVGTEAGTMGTHGSPTDFVGLPIWSHGISVWFHVVPCVFFAHGHMGPHGFLYKPRAERQQGSYLNSGRKWLTNSSKGVEPFTDTHHPQLGGNLPQTSAAASSNFLYQP
ncbi:alpha/beta-hydrolase [Zalerion maritima]|uniref:Alpha/beta-hydrolase n=1 Tax=Zalerion maritima TaxID=339359 RepID=A0AAD5WVL0_9PEZI|nr:alpha/beta-hydrolase [Zalerion maritima]